MFYLYGNEEYLIDEKIKEIIVSNPKAVVLNFNANSKLNEIINQISNFSLFEENKIIILRNINQLTNNNLEEQKEIIHSLSFKQDTKTIIFTSEKLQTSLVNKNELYKYLIKNAKCYEINELKENEIVPFVKDKIKELGGSIDELDLYYLLSKLPNKLTIIIQEIEKLIILDKNISKSNIDDSVQKYNLVKTFDFINSFHDHNIDLLFQSYIEKINQGETIQNFISQLINVLEISSRIYSLKKMGMNNEKIEKTINKHSFVIKKNIEFIRNVGYKKINFFINRLCDIDEKIKRGLIDENIGFERFLLEVIKND